MSDGKIEFDTAINTDGLEKGIKKLQKNLGVLKGAGMSAIIGAEVKALKSLVNEIDETSKAYNTQIKAEKQLEQAAKNNPYLNASSVATLKDFASELQKVSTVGDEQLLPLMAQLAASGRTQAEIQNIMNAALDVSASGMMSLDSAVQQLNGTYSGNIGLLGRQITELKNLTKEELESGKAVDIMAEKFRGMSKEVTDATGAYEQMKNAQGDFKEAVGSITKPTSDLWNNFWKGWYERGIENINKLEAKLDAQTIGKKLAKQFNDNLAKFETGDIGGRIDYIRNSLGVITDDELTALNTYYETKKKLTTNEEQVYNRIKAEADARKQNAINIAAETEAQAKQTAAEKKAAEEEKDRNQKATDYMNANQKALDTKLKQMEIEARLTGEEVDEQEKLNVLMQSYIDLVTGSNLVTENNMFAKKRLEELLAYADGIKVVTDDTEKYLKVLEDVNDYMSEANRITSEASEMFLNSISSTTQNELDHLSEQYTQGLIDYEEYCDKKKKISQKSAQEEYKIKMWEWSSSLLTATANIAQGVSKAIAEGGVAGIITGALVSAAGAIQIGNIVANKPTMPKFANGGYVPGNSTSGDKVHALVNSGELVLNSREQAVIKSLVGNNTANGGAVVNMPVTIENNTGANVSTQMDSNGLTVIIDEIVNSSMAAGKYTNSMAIAQNRANGVSYY